MPRMDRSMALVMALTVTLMLGLLLMVLVGPGKTTGRPDGADGGQGAEILTARVIQVQEEGMRDLGDGTLSGYQKLLVLVESGSLRGQEVVVEEGVINTTSEQKFFRPGDRVYLSRVSGPEGDHLFISDYMRSTALFWVFAIFAVLVVLVGWSKGLRSLAGT
ncbi:MAG: hypothetical protein H5T84_04820, partial [Thermoleophilia bacterium]|nr:hypothetical protein [Thermoleophilia bacterium]